MRLRPALVLLAAALPLVFAGSPGGIAAQAPAPYDIVPAGGRVMDQETGLDGIRWVGIRGESVVVISDGPLDGRTVIDTTGLVVAHGAARTSVMRRYAGELEAAANRRAGQDDMEGFMRLYDAAAAGRYDALDPSMYPSLWERLEAGLRAGALGIGMPHRYYRGVTRDEIFRLFEFASAAEVPIYTHVRAVGVQPIQEVVANAAATGASLHVVHLNSSTLWEYRTNIDLILGAQERGADITTEAYPYTAASTSLQSSIFDEGWQDRLRISYGDLQGQDTGERLTHETFTRYREEGGVVIIHMMKPEWIEAFMADPRIMVPSDGMPYAPGATPAAPAPSPVSWAATSGTTGCSP